MTGEKQSSEGCAKCRQAIHCCGKLLRQLQASIITLDEFDYNTAIHLLITCDPCMRSYLDSLSDPTAAQLSEYLQATLESEGPVPFVRPFIVDFGCEEEIPLKTQEVSPKIGHLCQAAKDRASGLLSSRRPLG